MLLMGAALLTGCIYLPQTTTRYDPECGVQQRHMTLEVTQVGLFGRCVNDGCVELLVLAGVVSATTAVVSGSVVVVGNGVYWLEEKGRCLNEKRKARQAVREQARDTPVP
ncbi:conserved protein of unknown function [Denitratisoma oestradiolicum]|uniref:Uncharacterized protein n=2 Tax=Denitratisoma oestradiolicum TaxID=311182 RepID=A0A6S6YCM6_9PROT|nr:hypothetical protein CBW56_13695 [Denitratisoma oestradiolicum]CAB1370426.1 conserved protein of unknown function [Denitratisoma oestradiolicum]